MKYALLIYADEAIENAMTEEEQGAMYQEYFAFTESERAAGTMLGGEALQPVATATTVSVRDGKTITVDGPFAETKEQLGGFYLLEVANLDDAIEAAARIPGARSGRVEIRPLIEFDDM